MAVTAKTVLRVYPPLARPIHHARWVAATTEVTIATPMRPVAAIGGRRAVSRAHPGRNMSTGQAITIASGGTRYAIASRATSAGTASAIGGTPCGRSIARILCCPLR